MLLSIAKCSFVALTVLTAAAQFFFMYAEMRRWPKVAKLLTKMSDECVKESEPLGANMGLYNGFLALGLVWSLLAQYLFGTQLTHDLFGVLLALFFLGCVLTAAAYGAYSVSPLLLPMQGSWPFLALIALSIFWWLSPAAAVK